MIRVLLVDDEQRMRAMIQLYLNANGMSVTDAQDGEEALILLQSYDFDLIVLDLMMPKLDGYTFLQNTQRNIPVLVLTAKDRVEDKLRGFELGIDDYITKPFDLRELAARIRVLARRSMRQSEPTISAEWIMDSDAKRLCIYGQELPLTPKEFHILELLSQRPSRVYTRDELLEQIWGFDFEGDVRVVDTHVKNIRDKCRRAGLSFVPVVTVWGIGYRMGRNQTG